MLTLNRVERWLGIICIIVWVAAAMRVFAIEAQERDLRGFGGYAYGSSIDDIKRELKADGYVLLEETPESLWYLGEMYGLHMQLGYVFVDGKLVGGAWDIEETRGADFIKVMIELVELYGKEEKTLFGDGAITGPLQYFGDRVSYVLEGPDSVIKHEHEEGVIHTVTFKRKE